MSYNRFWQKFYRDGVPHNILELEHNNIYEMFESTCEKVEENVAFYNFGQAITYGELLWRVSQLASYFQNELGLKKGDRIAIQLPNIIQTPLVIFAAFKAGLIVVNTNPLYTAREMEYQFNDSGAKAVFILENFLDKLESIIDNTQIEHVISTRVGDMIKFPKGKIIDFVLKYVKKQIPKYSIKPIWLLDVFKTEIKPTTSPELELEDVAFLQYTGGTTGRSKGAVLSHRNVLSNIEQVVSWFGDDPLTEDDLVATPLPLYHIFSLTCNMMLSVRIGFSNLLITNPRDFGSFLKDLANYPCTIITGVNTLFNAMLTKKGFDKVNWKTYRLVVAGGASLQQAVSDEYKMRTGVSIVEGYGLSETSPIVCANQFGEDNNPGTIGFPLPSTDVCFFGEDGKIVPRGEVGEISVKGPQVMRGYWNKPEETEKVFRDGWFLTGDMGYMDEYGYVRIVDRKKDMILVSGFNVYPNEVEGVLVKHPAIMECAVVGIDDEKAGERPVAVFALNDGHNVTGTELKDHCAEALTKYKVPKDYLLVNELPKSPIGKVLRRVVRELVDQGNLNKV